LSAPSAYYTAPPAPSVSYVGPLAPSSYYTPSPQHQYVRQNPTVPIAPAVAPQASPFMTKEEIKSLAEQLIVQSLVKQKARSFTENCCKLPPVSYPPSFKTPKYKMYNRTTDPKAHLLTFARDSQQFRHDKALLVHLFQKTLARDALEWFI